MLGLSECDHAVVSTEKVVKHGLFDGRDSRDGSPPRDLCAVLQR